MKLTKLRLAFSSVLVLLAISNTFAAGPKESNLSRDWIRLETSHFLYLFQERDRPFVGELLSAQDEVWKTVGGFFRWMPSWKVPVIVRGNQDSGSVGGMTATFPLRIELVVSHQPARVLLQHELTHYVNATRPRGLMYAVGAVLGQDLAMAGISPELHQIEGLTSLIDGERSDVWNEMLYKAALYEERGWPEQDIWNGSSFQPGPLRVYLSQMLFCDYLYRHFGAGVFEKINDVYADFPFYGDAEAIQRATGMETESIWSAALAEARTRFATDFALAPPITLTPRSPTFQFQWSNLAWSSRGVLQLRRSLDDLPSFGFWIPPATLPSGSALADPGVWFPLHGMTEVPTGISLSAGGTLAAFSMPQNQPGSSFNQDVDSDLYVAAIKPGKSSYELAPRLLVSGHSLSAPALSPDGTRLLAVERASSNFRLVEVDLSSGTIVPVLDFGSTPGSPSLVSARFSPDGAELALVLDRQGQTDVATAKLPSHGGHVDPASVRWITHDSPKEYAARFLADGRLVFASDRENFMALYSADNDGKVTRLLRDPVGAWAGEFGRAEFAAPDGHALPSSGDGVLFYDSYTADGYAVKAVARADLGGRAIDEFANLIPDYAIKHDALVADFQRRSVLPTPTPAASETQTERPFIDLAVPREWMPLVSYDLEGTAVGVAFNAYSLLGMNSWNGQVSYVFPIGNPGLPGQLDVKLGAALTLPEIDAWASVSEEYQRVLVGSTESHRQLWTIAAGASLPLVSVRTLDGVTSLFSLGADIRARWAVASSTYFSFYDGWTMPSNFGLVVSPHLEAQWTADAAASQMYGSWGLFLDSRAYFVPIDGTVTPAEIAVRLGAQPRIPLGNSLLNLRVQGAWSLAGFAADYLDNLGISWTFPQTAWKINVRARLDLADAYLPHRRFLDLLALDSSGVSLMIQSGLAADASGAAAWDERIQFGAQLNLRPLLYYNAIPLEVGAAFQLRKAVMDDLDSVHIGDFSVWVGVN